MRLVTYIQGMNSLNNTWDLLPFGTWTQLESNIGIWCACMPALARLVKRFWVEVLGNKLSTYLNGGTASQPMPGSFAKSRNSHKAPSASSEADLTDVRPQNGVVAKTVTSKVVYDNDEVELMDHDSIENDLNTQHKYIRAW